MRDAIARARARFAEQEAHERADRARMRTLFAGDCALCFDTGTNPDTALWCDACERGRDAATRARELADERRRDEWRELLRGANIPPRYWTHSLDSYPWQQSPSLADLREFLTTWDGATGLMLAGDYGRGKTGLIVGAMRQIARDYAGTTRRMLFVPSVSLLDGLRAGYGDSTYDAQMGRLCSVQLLCLDDLAREGISEWARSTLFDILNTRYNAGLPVFVTTNHTLDGLAYRLGEAITQRLEETCIRIEVVGRSLRHAPTLGGR